MNRYVWLGLISTKKIEILYFLFCQMFYVSNWKYIKCWDAKQTFMYLILFRFYYFKHIVNVK